jgi:hypothetical protein
MISRIMSGGVPHSPATKCFVSEIMPGFLEQYRPHKQYVLPRQTGEVIAVRSPKSAPCITVCRPSILAETRCHSSAFSSPSRTQRRTP